MHAVGLASRSITLRSVGFCPAIKRSLRSVILHFGPTPAHFLLSCSFPICMQMSINRSHMEPLPGVCACECLSGCVCHLPEASATARACIRARSRVSVHGYCSLKRVCMSTILDRACGGGGGGSACVRCCLFGALGASRERHSNLPISRRGGG